MICVRWWCSSTIRVHFAFLFFLPDYILYTYVPVCVYAIFNIDCYISGSRYRITVIIWNRQYIHTVCVRVRFFFVFILCRLIFCHFRYERAYKFNLENCCYELSINDVIVRREKIKTNEEEKNSVQKQALKGGERHMCTALTHTHIQFLSVNVRCQFIYVYYYLCERERQASHNVHDFGWQCQRQQ